MNPKAKELLEALLDDQTHLGDENCGCGEEPGCCGDSIPCGDLAWFLVLLKLKKILFLLTNRRFGLKEIKREVKNIEDNMNNNGQVAGPLSTGPIFIRTGQNNAVNVKVQNVGESPIDAEVRIFDIGACPPVLADSEILTDIGPCCAQDAVLTVDAGNYEVVVCPDPATATVRAFVSVHSGNATTSAFEYVVKAAEMLPLVCPFCEVEPD